MDVTREPEEPTHDDPDRSRGRNLAADGARVPDLEATVDRLERELARSRTRERESAAIARAHESELRRVRRELDSLRRRRSVRLALWGLSRFRAARNTFRTLAGRPRRALRRVRRRVDERVRQHGLRASPAAEAALVAALRANLPPATVCSGPLVSIVILSRDGREHLERCLRALAATTYRDMEVVIVDNGSTDGSAEAAERFDGWFPLRVVRNAVNRSFSDANDQGVAVAEGELICFLDIDADPITGEWLGYLVETLDRKEAVAVGARLIYPVHRGRRGAGAKHADLTLQHGGVDFNRELPIPMARAMGAGEDPLSATAIEVAERPALTGACLLVRRDAFLAVGGFARAYDHGFEDVDLCLRLRAAGGRLLYDGRAALWHHESATRAADQSAYLARVARNRDVFVDRWGPRLFRDCLLDALDGSRRWSDAPFHVAITLTSLDPDSGYGDWYTGHELGDALAALGWRVSYLARKDDGWYHPDRSVEAVIVLIDACDIRRLPRRLVSMAWIRNWPERWLEHPWFDEFDIVFGSSERIAAMVRERSAKAATLLPIATNPDRFEGPEAHPEMSCDVLFMGNYWGEQRDVVDALPALAERGIGVRIHGRGWERLSATAALGHGFLDYDDIPGAYAAALIVVDDAAPPTKDCGSVNSRVFDALAAGAIVVSSGAVGVHDLFGASFPTWSDASSLVDLVEGILRDPTPELDRARAYQTLVLAKHTYAIRARTVRDTLVAWASATRYGIRIGVPGWSEAGELGEYHFGRDLQRALERAGHPTRLHFLPDWEHPVSAREDVVVHLSVLAEGPTRSGQVNLLWQTRNSDPASPELYGHYDHAFVASDPLAARLAAARVAVTPLHLATDPERFQPASGGPRHELLFVADASEVNRSIVGDLAGTTHGLAVYGLGWTADLLDPRLVKGKGIPYEDLARYYSAAAIVLNDGRDTMGEEGFIPNRIYDALACGAFVVSDHVEGIAAEFDGVVPTYRGPEELNALIERYLAAPSERQRLAAAGRAIVLARHTFEVRARALCDVADRIVAEREDRVPPSASTPSAEPVERTDQPAETASAPVGDRAPRLSSVASSAANGNWGSSEV